VRWLILFFWKQNFYLAIRRALTHPKCSENWSGPKTLEEWDETKSKKLETLVALIKHHLADDNAPAVTILNNQIVPDSPEMTNNQLPNPPPSAIPPPKPATPTKVVVYNPFPADNELVKVVSHFNVSMISLLIHDINAGPEASWH
jgi:hypothetical protein